MRRRDPARWLDRLRLSRPRPAESAAWEVEHHIEETVDRLRDEGWEEGAARREAERRFGDANRYVPEMRRLEEGRMAMEARTLWMDLLGEALASVIRTARGHPGFTFGVVVTLGLGIGANATMYGIVDRLLLRPPTHVVDADHVKRVFLERPAFVGDGVITGASLTYPDYQDLRAHSAVDVAGYAGPETMTVGHGESAQRIRASLVSAGFFPLLGVTPRMGRFFSEDETRPGTPLTAVLSEEYWERAYGRAKDVLGRTMEIQGASATVIGIAPEGFTGVDLEPVDAWLPLEPMHVLQQDGEGCMTSRGCWWLRVAARLHDGVSLPSAEAEATGLHHGGRGQQIESGRYPAESRLLFAPLIAARGPDGSNESDVATWLAGVSAIVLLIACANVANLLMARGTRRRREVSVRLALGASRRRVVAQLMMESVVLALLGGALALFLARWGGWVVRSALLPGVSFPHETVSGRLVLFTMAAALLSGLLAGLGPALHSRRVDLAGALGEESRGSSAARSRLRSTLAVAQAAMSVVLLVGAGLFVRSLSELRQLELGLDVERLLLVSPELARSDLTREEVGALYDEVVRRVENLPGVESGTVTAVPFQWGYATSLEVPGVDSIPRLPGGGPYYYPVTPSYFRTLGLSLVAGREFQPSDGPTDDKVAVVSETMASTLWPGTDALGRCLLVGDDATQCTTVVGVVQDAARSGYQDEPYMAYYLPLSQGDLAPQGVYVRVAGPADAARAEVAAALRGVPPTIRFTNVRPLQELLDPQARAWTLGATMFSVFGLLALLVAAVGLYSVLAFDVAQRTRELGIRAALGAQRSRLLGSVLGQGGRLVLGGVGVGLGVAWIAAPRLSDLLFNVSPHDPWVLGSVAAALLAVGGAASAVPGLRAVAVPPTEALRAE